MLSKDTADLLFETLDAVGKHTTRLNNLDKQTKDQSTDFSRIVSVLEKQIETSSKDMLLQILDKGNTDKDQLVKDITNAIATSIANLSIKSGDVIVNIETDSIANVLAKLPINNTNNITIDTKELSKDNKQMLNTFQSMDKNLYDTLNALKIMFSEMHKTNNLPISTNTPAKEIPMISGMEIVRNKDNLLDYVKFVRSH